MSLQISGASYQIGGNHLLKEVNLTLQPSSINALIGPNGAGKTTLLRVASGELVAGEVTLDSIPVAEIPLGERARRIAFLTQNSALDFPFKGFEVIQMGRIPHSTGRKYNERVVNEVVRKCGLQELASRIYTTMSGGEKQRIQVGRVLCQVWDNLDAAYVLFDEPTAALDLSHQLIFFEVVQMLASMGTSVTLVLHDINLASRFADNITMLVDGQVLAEGPPAEVLTRENIKQTFSVDVDILGSGTRPLIQATSTSQDIYQTIQSNGPN